MTEPATWLACTAAGGQNVQPLVELSQIIQQNFDLTRASAYLSERWNCKNLVHYRLAGLNCENLFDIWF
jgi:hypothetical protein